MGKYDEQNKARFVSNDQVCSCGKHKGIGNATPHERAQMYNWFRERGRPEWDRNEGNCKEYLLSYEAAHGKLRPDSFLFNDSRYAQA